MTVVVPRLDRESAGDLIARHLDSGHAEMAAAMPDLSPVVTYSPVGGARIEEAELRALRVAMLDLATEHGMPLTPERTAEFEGRAARLLHRALPMTPHEAAHEEVWSYLTCCWLLDVAVWRFGHEADERRFIGNVNRNTFRRMWWRAEVLGPDVDLTRLGEDELVNIMERPTIASDRRLARAVATEFLDRVERGEATERMQLMREAMKRLLRLTPFVAFPALDDSDLRMVVTDAFDAAAAGLAGEEVVAPARVPGAAPAPTPDVVAIPRMTIAHGSEPVGAVDEHVAQDFETVAQAALDIARRAGRVTNMSLREVVAITSDEAREVFQALMHEGALVRRGVKRGTHYVLPEPAEGTGADTGNAAPPPPPEPAEAPSVDAPTPPRPADGLGRRSAETPLRRLLRRGR